MSITSSPLKKFAAAAAILTTTACNATLPPIYQDEGRVLGGAIGAAVGAVLTDGKSRTTQAAGTAATTAIGGVLGGAFADQNTTCRDEETTRRRTTVVNGERQNDTQTSDASKHCEGGRTNGASVGNPRLN